MAYQIEAELTKEQMVLETRDWWNLLEMASKYGWRPAGGAQEKEGYIYNPDVIPAGVAHSIATALVKAMADVPAQMQERTDSVLAGPDDNPLAYFGGEHKQVVSDFIQMCQKGRLRVSHTPTL